MRKYFFALTLLLCSMTALAQEKKDTVFITLRNGTEVRYTSDQFDRVQIIYNLNYGVKVYLKNGKSKDYLATEVRVGKYQSGGGEVVTGNNANRNLYRAKLLEYPHLAEDSTMNQLIIKSTADYGITYSLEWSYKDKANRWSCYQMHAGNMEDNTDRNKNFYEDEEIPEEYRSKLADYSGSGFSRGHLCPSADRLCSEEQNKQTFFLSNMQPQWQKHNGVIWANFEDKVREWAAKCDTLYVVKAATIRSDQVYEDIKCNDELLVPKFFYMALLAYYLPTEEKPDGSYEAMALWTVHEDKSVTKADFKDYAISIDELEERTGIDFFCNLPDDIEDDVERECHTDKWELTTE